MNYIQQGIKVGDKVWTIQDGGYSLAGFVVLSPKLIHSGESKMTLVSGRGGVA